MEEQKGIITLTYQFPDENHKFVIENVDIIDVNQVSEVAATSNESYEYSGRHDHGKLPQMKSSGPVATILSALREAKRINDQFMTEKINVVYGYGVKDEIDPNEEAAEQSDDSNTEKKGKKANTKRKEKKNSVSNKKPKLGSP